MRIAHLLAPPSCGGCRTPGSEWCAACAAVMPRPHWREAGLPVLVHHRFEGPIRRCIIDWKDEGLADARRRVVSWMAEGLRPLCAAVPDAIIVPIPSSVRADRVRGRSALLDVVREALPHREVMPFLMSVGARRDQAGLTRAQRAANVRGAFRWEGPRNRDIIIVDDVLTTGATMRSAAATVTLDDPALMVGFTLAERGHFAPVDSDIPGLCWRQDDVGGTSWTTTQPPRNPLWS